MKATYKLSLFFFLSLIICFSCSESESDNTEPKEMPREEQPTEAKTENSLLWRISGKGLEKPSYLFGTIHLICQKDFFMPEAAEEMLKETERIAFELDMDDPAVLMGMAGKMNMRNDTVLSDLLEAEDLEILSTWFKDSIGVDLASVAGQKPFVLTSMMYPKMMQCKSLTSFEGTFMDMAREQEKEIIGLETVEYQMGIFDSIPYSVQAEELVKMVERWDSTVIELAELVESYKSQDISSAAESFKESSAGMEEFEEVLLQNRNKLWISRIDSITHEQPTFIAVGAGHLGGEEGVINLLKAEGFTLEPIK